MGLKLMLAWYCSLLNGSYGLSSPSVINVICIERLLPRVSGGKRVHDVSIYISLYCSACLIWNENTSLSSLNSSSFSLSFYFLLFLCPCPFCSHQCYIFIDFYLKLLSSPFNLKYMYQKWYQSHRSSDLVAVDARFQRLQETQQRQLTRDVAEQFGRISAWQETLNLKHKQLKKLVTNAEIASSKGGHRGFSAISDESAASNFGFACYGFKQKL